MTRAVASYRGEELEVQFSAAVEMVDYGVPRSPVWPEFTDPRVEAVTILGVDLPFDSLPEKLKNEIHALHTEVEFEREYA